MYPKTIFATFAAVASIFPVALGAGTVIIENQCADDVYLWSTAEKASEMKTFHSGEKYTEQYRLNKNGGGISIKMSLDKSMKDISQIEYTLDGQKVWYDLSNIDGYPFKDGGVSIAPSDSSCPKVYCAAGDAKCKEAYNKSDDNDATKACASTADLQVQLCAEKKGAKLKQKSFIPRHPHARPE
ncbi:GPI anchored cell wall protein [Coccidioides immitis RS]|uniref:GPI anchored cell wall protein n=4 Tax=Coccidioides immitis TaxID=5501 RepID=J3KK83_COCIM|nr:GPI anchored cell wall protein [Coccidioides immitis RS]KMP01926.1 hypothetical protein CIRG_02065 [Coccidioides immitis RMSCC 2394]KMU72995.1 hypothetical protein CISG_09876 [Coccidioides immitis RMSCC 3703]KMU90336.1 hypothetical protein CIHG_08145 [Coccidioides immitis H538.4]TPX25333.1 hypothetical protein DIZ76_010785 [Coccidioides immitis]EAS36563.3 GPI anchored cell wall protein [Coccidioides immitis RS]